MKIRLAICLNDDIYQERFVRCVIKHYAQAYELHVFKDLVELQEEGIHRYDGFILEECKLQELGWDEEKIRRTLLLKEEDKYQEVSRIMEELERLLADLGMNLPVEKRIKPKIFGVYSLAVPALQIPFCVVLNEILAEEKKVIFLDLQEHSGFCKKGELGLDDMMAMATAENYVRSRMQAAIGHMNEWDYVIPLKNTCYLLEGKKELFQSITEKMVLELGYDAVVINLGEIVINQPGLSNLCDQLFVLSPKGSIGEWREKHLIDELERKGEQDVLHRVQRMEIPTVSGTSGEWEKLSEQWKWSNLGNSLRKIVWEEKNLG